MTDAVKNRQASIAWARRPWFKAFLLASAVFVSGLIVGVVSASTYFWHHAITPPPFMVERMLNEMQSELELTPDQLQQLHQVFSSHRERMTAIHNEVQPKIEKELQSLDARVASILTPDQAKQWTARFNQMKKRWMPPPPEPGAPPGVPHPGPGGPRPEPPGPRPPQFGPMQPGMPGPPPGEPGGPPPDQRGPRRPDLGPQQPRPFGPPPGEPGGPPPDQRGPRRPDLGPQQPGPFGPPPGQPGGPQQPPREPQPPGPDNPQPPPRPPDPPPHP